jgi:hypothetical protein
MKYWNQTPTAARKGHRPLAHEQQCQRRLKSDRRATDEN